ncbi:MAG: DNA repair protein RecO [Candidatus Eremiobacterota bacterium]
MLRRRPLGEADEVVTCLSPTEGKLDAAVRGSRRSSSRLVGLLEPFTHLQAQLVRGRSLDTLTQARAVKSFRPLRENLDLLVSGSYLLELWAGCLPFREPSRRAFSLLLTGLEHLCQGIHPDLLCRWLELQLVDELGYAPQVAPCCSCGRPPRQGGYFSPQLGELACRSCGPPAPDALRLGSQTISALWHLRRMQPGELQGRSPSPGLARELEGVLRAHLSYHWPQAAGSFRVLRSLRAV